MRTSDEFSILLVDDDPMVIRILSRILSDFKPLRFATSGQSALKLARAAVPDLILLDVEMPELGGFEVCKALKADSTLADVPVIFITSHDSPQLQARGIELGGVDFIRKPPHPPLVVARVRAYQRIKQLSDTVRSAVTLDFLTGTASRRHFEKVSAQEWLRAQRTGAPLALLIIDIDNFTAFNEAYGDVVADECLKSVAAALGSVAQRPTDVLARYAGGKFGLLLPETDSAGATTVAQRMTESVAALRIDYSRSPGATAYISVTVGGCRRLPAAGAPPSDDKSLELAPAELLRGAERALLIAKTAADSKPRFIDIGITAPETALAAAAQN